MYPQQEWDPERPEHLLVEVSHRDEHLVLLVDVYLVQRYFLGTHRVGRRSVKANTALHVWIPNSFDSFLKQGSEGRFLPQGHVRGSRE